MKTVHYRPANKLINADGKYVCAKRNNKIKSCGGGRTFASPPVIMNRYVARIEMDYKTSTEDHLKRARQQLDSGTSAGIFYAAFELRCGIESRMFRYLEARETITKLKRKGWRIAKIASQIEGTFNTRGKICSMSFQDENKKLPVTEFKYIPISKELKKMAEKLGDFMHAQASYRPNEDPWWNETRSYLETVYEELSFIASGSLMGAPLLNPKTNEFHLEIELPREEKSKLEVLNKSFQEIKHIKVKVEYYKREAT